MTNKKFIDLAEKAGIEWDWASNCSEYRVQFEELQAFAQLVRNDALEEAANAFDGARTEHTYQNISKVIRSMKK